MKLFAYLAHKIFRIKPELFMYLVHKQFWSKTINGEWKMNFQLSEEHEQLREMIREFALNEVAPSAAERDEEERFDIEIWNKMAELGLTEFLGLKSMEALVSISWPMRLQLRSCREFVRLQGLRYLHIRL